MNARANRRADPVDGFLLLNKPAGLTSNQALQRVKRMLNARKAGHAGSLDPAATGMLPLCFGEATKVCAFLLDADKVYRVTARLGTATDTGDADGEPIAEAPVPERSRDEWDAILQSFRGASMQIPPMYSALKKGGKRLYELARRGETVEREARPIRIEELRLLEAAGRRLVFRVRCTKGTYVRTLVEDIARAAGTVAHTAALHRESVGGFRPEDMHDLAGFEAEDAESLRRHLLPADRALAGMPEVRLGTAESGRFVHGQIVAATAAVSPGPVRVYGSESAFLGVGELTAAGTLVPRRLFNTGE